MKKFLSIISICLLVPVFLFAQSPGDQQLQVEGLGISPFLIETKVESGKQQLQRISLSNNTDADLPIEVSINDFIPSGEGQPSFLPAGEVSDPKFSLSQWIRIVEQPNFTIPAGGSTEIVFSITPPVDAEPGTHYGGLLFSFRRVIDRSSNVTVTQKAGALILAELGNAEQKGAVTELRAEPSLDANQVRFFLSYYNQGNVHLKPKGEIFVSDMLGRQVGNVPINRDANIIFPQQSRTFDASWSPGWRIGRFTATSVIYFGNPKIEARTIVSFWIIPWQKIAIVAIVLLALSSTGKLAVARYNRWIIARHSIGDSKSGKKR